MSLRRSSRRSCGGGGRKKNVVCEDAPEVPNSKRQGILTLKGKHAAGKPENGLARSTRSTGSITRVKKDVSSSKNSSKRLFVGDCVVFCSKLTQTKVAYERTRLPIEEIEEVPTTATLEPDSLPTDGTSSTDSIVSSSVSSSNDNSQPKRKSPPPSISSSSSLVSDTNVEGPSKKKMRHRPLFKRKLNINLTAVPNNDSTEEKTDSSERKTPPFDTNAKDPNSSMAANDENLHCNRKTRDDYEFTIQQLLSLTSQRALEAQSKLTLTQLKQQARQKAREAKACRVQPKKKRKGKKRSRSKKQKKSPASDVESENIEPMEVVEMSTGTLYLYRGEKPRANFVRRR